MKIVEYDNSCHNELIRFLEKCLPESGRMLEINGRHKAYSDIQKYYTKFWCMMIMKKS